MSTAVIVIILLVVLIVVAGLFLLYRYNVHKRTRGSVQQTGQPKHPPYKNQQIYIGNLNYRVSEQDLAQIFKSYGHIERVRVVRQGDTHKSKGYAFITYSSTQEADNALAAHGKSIKGRNLVVRIAKPRLDKPMYARD